MAEFLYDSSNIVCAEGQILVVAAATKQSRNTIYSGRHNSGMLRYIFSHTRISASDQEARISRMQKRLSIKSFEDASLSILKKEFSYEFVISSVTFRYISKRFHCRSIQLLLELLE